MNHKNTYRNLTLITGIVVALIVIFAIWVRPNMGNRTTATPILQKGRISTVVPSVVRELVFWTKKMH